MEGAFKWGDYCHTSVGQLSHFYNLLKVVYH